MTDRSFDIVSRSAPKSIGQSHRSFEFTSFDQFPEYGGYGYIAGILPGLVTVNSVPGPRNLKLFSRYGGKLLRVTRSLDDGSYRFAGLNENQIFQLVGQDDPTPPVWQAVALDFLVPVIDAIALWRDGTTARAVCAHHYLQSTLIRVLHADQAAWNADFVLSAVGVGWVEFTVAADLPAYPTGEIMLQRRY